jgi:hypothetical protein
MDPRNSARGMGSQHTRGNYDQNQIQQQPPTQQHTGDYQGEFQPRQGNGQQQYYQQPQMQSQHHNYQQPNNYY